MLEITLYPWPRFPKNKVITNSFPVCLTALDIPTRCRCCVRCKCINSFSESACSFADQKTEQVERMSNKISGPFQVSRITLGLIQNFYSFLHTPSFHRLGPSLLSSKAFKLQWSPLPQALKTSLVQIISSHQW